MSMASNLISTRRALLISFNQWLLFMVENIKGECFLQKLEARGVMMVLYFDAKDLSQPMEYC